MASSIALVTVVVRDYDEAIAWYTQALGFRLLEDTPRGPGKRWVRVGPDGGGTALLLAQPSDEAQAACIGCQAGGRVGFFLHTDDFDRDHAAMAARGVRFRQAPRRGAYGSVAVFEDLYGNAWDLLERKATAEPRA